MPKPPVELTEEQKKEQARLDALAAKRQAVDLLEQKKKADADAIAQAQQAKSQAIKQGKMAEFSKAWQKVEDTSKKMSDADLSSYATYQHSMMKIFGLSCEIWEAGGLYLSAQGVTGGNIAAGSAKGTWAVIKNVVLLPKTMFYDAPVALKNTAEWGYEKAFVAEGARKGAMFAIPQVIKASTCDDKGHVSFTSLADMTDDKNQSILPGANPQLVAAMNQVNEKFVQAFLADKGYIQSADGAYTKNNAPLTEADFETLKEDKNNGLNVFMQSQRVRMEAEPAGFQPAPKDDEEPSLFSRMNPFR